MHSTSDGTIRVNSIHIHLGEGSAEIILNPGHMCSQNHILNNEDKFYSTRLPSTAGCLTSLPKQVLKKVRSSASSLTFQYLIVSLRSSSSCLRLLPRLPVFPSIITSIFHSIMCFRRQFLRNL